ncbi:MAG: hypothetical protein U0694_09735 [Anaerolineae bacterium]
MIDTHLHADHAAGNMSFGENGALVPTFPNAEYVVQRREYDDAMRPTNGTRATYNLKIINRWSKAVRCACWMAIRNWRQGLLGGHAGAYAGTYERAL